MRMGQGVRTGLGHGGITCVLQTQFSSFFFFFFWGGGGGEGGGTKIIPYLFGCYNLKGGDWITW